MEILNTIFRFNYIQFESFILILVRFSGLFVSAPVISSRNIPRMAKIGLCLFLSLVVMPFIKTIPEPFTSNITFAGAMGKELAVGIVLGFFITLIFVALQVAGQFMDYQTGFGMVNIIDPESRVQVPLMGQFLYILSILLFLVIGGHHLTIESLVRSFDVFPLGRVDVDGQVMLFINKAFGRVLLLSFKVAAPIVAAVFLRDIGYGVMARAIPQMNILIVGLPLKIGLGMVIMTLSLPLFFWVMKKEFLNIFLSLKNLFNLL